MFFLSNPSSGGSLFDSRSCEVSILSNAVDCNPGCGGDNPNRYDVCVKDVLDRVNSSLNNLKQLFPKGQSNELLAGLPSNLGKWSSMIDNFVELAKDLRSLRDIDKNFKSLIDGNGLCSIGSAADCSVYNKIINEFKDYYRLIRKEVTNGCMVLEVAGCVSGHDIICKASDGDVVSPYNVANFKGLPKKLGNRRGCGVMTVGDFLSEGTEGTSSVGRLSMFGDCLSYFGKELASVKEKADNYFRSNDMSFGR